MKAGYGYAIVGTGTTRVGFEADVEELSDRDLDTLERQAAEIMARVREEQDRRLGIRTTGGIYRGGPWTVSLDYGAGYIPGISWVDHPYAAIVGGRKRFVSEPYWLDGRDLPDLIDLQAKGWTVTISATRARWFPGHTLAIELERKAANA
jgi:hypothetical protein